MRHPGMAICDAALLQDNEVVGDEIHYFRKKTKRKKKRVFVQVPIPADLHERLQKLKNERGLVGPGKKYYFCHGSDYLVSATDVWHSRLRRVFEKAGIKNGKSHQFRHTFAHDWLTRGTDVEIVAQWMGHMSSATTRKYYSHWITNRVNASKKIMRDRFAEEESTGHDKRYLVP